MSCAGMQTERLQWVRHLSHPCSMAAKQTAAQHKQEVMITQRSSPVNKLGLVRQLSRSQQGGEEEGRKEGRLWLQVGHACQSGNQAGGEGEGDGGLSLVSCPRSTAPIRQRPPHVARRQPHHPTAGGLPFSGQLSIYY